MYSPKETIESLFYGTCTRHEKVLTKNIPRLRDLEDIIVCPRVMVTYAFLTIFFKNVLQHKEKD